MKTKTILTLALALALSGCSQAQSPKNKEEEPLNAAASSAPNKQESEASRKAKEAEQARMEEEQFKESANRIAYKDLARNTERFKSEKAYFFGKVIQAQENKNRVTLRVEVTRGEYDIWDDAIWVNYTKKEGEDRILEDDLVQVWGTIKGLKTYTAVMGNEISIPEIDAKYISLSDPSKATAKNEGTINKAPSQPPAVARETPVPAEASTKADDYLFDELYRNYEESLVNAINAGDFALVEDMLLPGSSLYKEQKALVKNLSEKGIKEKLVSYDILDAQYNKDSATIRMRVNEEVKVIKQDGESVVKSTWIYTVTQSGDGMFRFSEIKKP